MDKMDPVTLIVAGIVLLVLFNMVHDYLALGCMAAGAVYTYKWLHDQDHHRRHK